MTQRFTAGSPATAGGPAAEGQHDEPRLVIRDRRRLDPSTGQLRDVPGAAARPTAQPTAQEDASMSNDNRPDSAGDDAPYQGRHARAGEGDHVGAPDSGVPGSWPGADDGLTPSGPPTSPATGQASANAARAAYQDAAKSAPPPAPESNRPEEASMSDSAPAQAGGQPADGTAASEHPDTLLAAERLADLQRLQAEYVNYKRRVDRDRNVERDRAVASVVESLLPVLDEIQLARQHGELETGPFAKIAEKLEGILGKQGLERFGQPGDAFDPAVHEAVMHVQAELAPGTTGTTVVQVMQPGFMLGERVVRPALVSVADPQE